MSHLIKTLLAMLMIGIVVLTAPPARAGDKLQVVTTTTDLAAIARFVGGDKADVMSVATGREDSHHIAAKPSYMMAVRKAELWIRMGMELEIGYESLILDGSRNTKIRIGTEGHLDASQGVLRLEVPTQKVDRSMGDIHPQGNPHYMLDPLNGRIVAKTIGQRMAKLAPQDADYFNQRVEAFQQQLDERMFGAELVGKLGGAKLWAALLKDKLDALLDTPGVPKLAGWLGAMRPYAGTKIVTYHRNWTYFVHRFGLIVPTEVESKPGIPPSPGRLTEVIQRMKAENIKVLITATYFSRQAPDLVAAETGARVVECAMFPGAIPEVTDYFTLFDNLVQRVSAALDQAATSQPEGGT